MSTSKTRSPDDHRDRRDAQAAAGLDCPGARAAVLAASELDERQLGEFLRRQGLHREQLDERTSMLEEALAQPRQGRRPSGDAKRIEELERELARKDKALAETAALLVLKKKLAQLWGDEDDDTDPRSEK